VPHDAVVTQAGVRSTTPALPHPAKRDSGRRSELTDFTIASWGLYRSMKNIKKLRKLNLDKSVIRNLTDDNLLQIAGATGDYCLLTPSCKFVCTKMY
jgi:hypothetical protein